MKYGNKKVKVDNIIFDSKKEARRYAELKMLIRCGEIDNLILQPQFELIPSFRKNGKTYRKTVYKADFSYYDRQKQKTIIEDTKGYRTELYRLKKKLFEYKYPDKEIIET